MNARFVKRLIGGGIFALASVVLTGCDLFEDSVQAPLVQRGQRYIVATTIDHLYSGGNIGWMSLDTDDVRKDLLPIFKDNSIKTYNGSVYVLEKGSKSNLLCFEGTSISATAIKYQVNLGININIQDIAFVNSTKAYITALGSTDLLIVNPTDGAKIGAIGLSQYNTYSTTSGKTVGPYPHMSSIVISGDFAYVACQRLDNNLGLADTSLIVKISTKGDSVVKAIPLKSKNPQAMCLRNNRLYISIVGAWGDTTDGGVECVDLLADTSMGVIVGESKLNGDASMGIIMVSDSAGYVCVSQNTADFLTFWTALVPFNVTTRTAGTKVESVDDAFGGLALVNDVLYVGDRSKTKPGIVSINPATGQKIAGPFDLGVAPSAIAALEITL